MASGPITSCQIEGEKVNSEQFYFLGLQNHCGWWLQSWNWKTHTHTHTQRKTLAPWKESNDNDKPREYIKKQRHHLADKGLYSQSYGFSSSHVWMWELDYKEGWTPTNWYLQIVVLEKTLENPLDCKEIKPDNSKGNQPWIFIGRTNTEALIVWTSDGKSRLIGKDSDAGKDWRQKEKGAAEDEVVR